MPTQALTGCTNPNTGVTNNDWGVQTWPVYTWISNTSPIIGKPVYTSNAIFWTSRETGPGQSILLAGAFTNATKSVRIAAILPGTTDWQSVVRGSTTKVTPLQVGTTALSFIVPSSFPAGVYGFEIDDPSTPATLGLANAPALNWAIGVPSVTAPDTALQHQVYDCGAEPGEMLRIFGKNFIPSDQVILQSSAGVLVVLAPEQPDTNSITVTVPSSLTPGSYNLWVGNAPWDATSSPTAQITIYSPPALTPRNISCSGLVGDVSTDNTKLLQTCLDDFAPLPGSNEIAYLALPRGTFVLNAGVTVKPYEVLIGESASSTTFIGRPTGTPPTAWFNLPQYSGLADFSLQAPPSPNLILSSGTNTGDPATSGHLFLSGLNFASNSNAWSSSQVAIDLAGPDIQVYASSFLGNADQLFDVWYGDGGVVSGNHFVINNWTGLGIVDSQNISFDHNETNSDNPLDEGANGNSGGSGLSVSRANNRFGPSALSRDIYIGYNRFHDMGGWYQQVITNDGDGGSYLGPVASSTSSTVTLADDPYWDWMGTTNPQAAVIAIISGTGIGQYSFLENYSGRTINVATPFKVPPDSTSIVVISQYEQNMTIAHNVIANTIGGSIVLGDALGGVVEDNILNNSGAGILISAFGPYGGPAAYGPVMDTDVLRNTILPGAGNYIYPSINTNVAGIGIQDMPGCLESGLLIRGNIVTSLETIYNTDGLNGINANLIEQNQAKWQPTFPNDQFVIQDNSPPPETNATGWFTNATGPWLRRGRKQIFPLQSPVINP